VAKRTTSELRIIARNRRARYDYEITQVFEAGLVLLGTEVKSLRAGQITLGEGYIQIIEGEAWLVNAHIPEYRYGNRFNHEPKRRRKLLLKQREIHRIRSRVKEQGFTAVPLRLYFRRGWAKLEFGLAKGRRQYDKRQAEREKVARRERDQY